MRNQISCECGHLSAYPETKDGVLVCSSCAMAYDYAKCAANHTPELFD